MTAGLPFSPARVSSDGGPPEPAAAAPRSAWRWRRRRTSARYYAIFALLLVGFAVLSVARVARPLARHSRTGRAVAVAATVAVLGVAPLAAVYAMIQRTTGFSRSVEAAGSFLPRWSCVPHVLGVRARVDAALHSTGGSESLFPGFVRSAFGIAGLVVRLGVEDGDGENSRCCTVAIAVLACWESFGPRAGLVSPHVRDRARLQFPSRAEPIRRRSSCSRSPSSRRLASRSFSTRVPRPTLVAPRSRS